MRTDFRLIDLRLPNIFCLSTLDGSFTFYIKSRWAEDRFQAFYKWAKSPGFSFENWYAEVEHSNFYGDGQPRNAQVINVRED
jgi:hypothetical protein